MAAPVVASTASGTQLSNVSSQVITLPDGVASGDLLLLFFACDGAPSGLTASGYTKLGVASECSVFWRRATGSDACTVSGMGGEKAAWIIYRITDGGDPTGTSATGSSATPNPPSFNAGSSADRLWFAAYGADDGELNLGFPTGYTGTAANGDGTSSVTAAAGWKQALASTTEDPGTFSYDDSSTWGAWTVSVAASSSGTTHSVASTDPAGSTDSAARPALFTRSVGYPAGLTDSASVGLLSSLADSDALGLTDSAEVSQELGSSATDAEALTDSHTITLIPPLSRTAADGAGLTDSAAPTFIPGPVDPIKEVVTDSGGGTNATITTSTNVAVGDVLVAFHGADYGSYANMPAITGTDEIYWVEQAGADRGNNLPKLKVWTREVATAGAQTVNAPVFADAAMYLTVFVLDGSVVDLVYDAAASSGAPTSSLVAPSVTAVADASVLLCGWLTGSDTSDVGNLTAPSGMTKETEVDSQYGTHATASELLSASGATGTRTASFSRSSDYASGSIAIALLSGDTEAVDSAGVSDSAALWRSSTRHDAAGLVDAESIEQQLIRAEGGGLTDSASVYRVASVAAVDSAGASDPASIQSGTNFRATAGLIDSAMVAGVFHRAEADDSGLSDAYTRTFGSSRSESTGASDSAALELHKAVTEHVGLGDTPGFEQRLTRAEVTGLAETVSVGSQSDRAGDDPAGLTDTASVTTTHHRAGDDPAGLMDSTAGSLIDTDALGLSDSAEFTAAWARAVSDRTGLSDAVTLTKQLAREATDAVGLADHNAARYAIERSDSTGLVDFTAGQVAKVDAAGLSDSVSVQLAHAPRDTFGITDTAALSWTRTKTATDSAGLVDRPPRVRLTNHDTHADAAGVSDTATVTQVFTVTAEDSTGLADHRKYLPTPFTETAGSTDSAAFTQTQARRDNTGLRDTVRVRRHRFVDAADTLGLGDPAAIQDNAFEHPEDTTGLADTASISRLVAVTDSIAVTDSSDPLLIRGHRDHAGLSDSLAITLHKGVADHAGAIDTATVFEVNTYTPTVSDTYTLTDEATVARHTVVTDAAGPSDSAVLSFTTGTRIRETTGLADSFVRSRGYGRGFAEATGLDDEYRLLCIRHHDAGTDEAGLADPAFISLRHPETGTDAAGITDATEISLTVNRVRKVERPKLTDSATVTRIESHTYADGAGLADSAIVEHQVAEELFATDPTGVSDTASIQPGLGAADAAALVDSFDVLLTRMVHASDAAGATDSAGFERTLTARSSVGLLERPAVTKIGPTSITIGAASEKWATGQARLNWDISEASIEWRT